MTTLMDEVSCLHNDLKLSTLRLNNNQQKLEISNINKLFKSIQNY